MATKSSKTTLRKADKPRTALKELKKQYSRVNDQYIRAKSDKGQFSDLAASGYDRDRRNIQKKIDAVQKTVNKNTKANNKDLSKSLGNVASNKGMKKSDGKGTYKQAIRDLGAVKDVASDMKSRYNNSTGIGAGAYAGMRRAEKDVKAQQKKVAELSKYNKGSRIAKKK